MNGELKYTYITPYKDVPTVPFSASGTFVPIDALMKLEQTINYMKQHPDVNVKPEIPGTTWYTWEELGGIYK